MGDRTSRRWTVSSVAVVAILGLVLAGACTKGASTTASPKEKLIPQPELQGLKAAPDSERVDLRLPTFSHPTDITNPLFPVSKQRSVLFLGHVDDKPFRTEVTLLSETRIIAWEGLRVETAVIQYNSFVDGRMDEIAYDLYAQADDDSVWYFGEDVFDFKDGRVFGTQGTWQAGRDGPACMIMPGHPKVGDVFRTENIPGIAFEEVTVKSVGETLDGPLGPIPGGLLGSELHSDGTREEKLFGPGYGEFYTSDGHDVEALALAVPTDAVSSPTPVELTTLQAGAADVFAAAGSKRWSQADATVEKLSAAWKAFPSADIPTLIKPVMEGWLDKLAKAVAARRAAPTRNAAIEVARSSLDIQLRYRPPAEIDAARFDLTAARLQVDAAAGDAAGVNSDYFTIRYLRDRLLTTLDTPLLARISTQLDEMQSALHDDDLAAASEAAQVLRDAVKGWETSS